jgi:hypothetical protein
MVLRSKQVMIALSLSLLACPIATSLPARADGWGAISVDLAKAERDPSYGIGGGDSEDEAVGNAQKFCKEAGGSMCKMVVTYRQCGAYAASHTGGGWGREATKKTAEAKAISGCDADDCKLVVSDCN